MTEKKKVMTSSDPSSLTPPRFLTTIQEELNEQLIALREEQPELAQLVDLLREEQQALALQRALTPSYPITINPTPDWTYRPPIAYPTYIPPTYFDQNWINTSSANYTINYPSSQVTIPFQVNGVDPLPEADDDEMGEWGEEETHA